MSEELHLPAPDRWSVVPVFQRQTKKEQKEKAAPVLRHYELRFESEVHARFTSAAELERHRFAARFMNSRGIRPKAIIDCAADSPNPEAYLHKLSTAPKK